MVMSEQPDVRVIDSDAVLVVWAAPGENGGYKIRYHRNDAIDPATAAAMLHSIAEKVAADGAGPGRGAV